MPELAEVELARRIWEPGLGQRIVAVETHPRTRVFRDTPASRLESALTASTLENSRAHGKRLLFSFRGKGLQSGRQDVEIHLGMAGRLLLAPPDYVPTTHDHFLLRTPEVSLVYSDYRQFGRVHLHAPAEDPWESLPPQVLDRRFTVAHLRALTKRRTGTAVKALLLDQAVFPGVGNWMADEICWRIPCHPAVPVGELDLAQLRRVSRQVCRGALRHVAERNATRAAAEGFSPGRYVDLVPPRTWLFQHRWKPGGTCPRCHSRLDRSTVASRSTAWCPACQAPLGRPPAPGT